jgi:hypothetical protein
MAGYLRLGGDLPTELMAEKRVFHCWAVAKLVRHQALDLAFEGSNPSRPAILVPDT